MQNTLNTPLPWRWLIVGAVLLIVAVSATLAHSDRAAKDARSRCEADQRMHRAVREAREAQQRKYAEALR